MTNESRFVKIARICALYIFPAIIVGLITIILVLPAPQR
jgi:hypothetical protein